MIYVIIAPSGSGKTTIGEYMKTKEIPEAISWTTRKKRKGEIEGVHYYFVTEEESKKEYSPCCTTYSGNKYGTWESEFSKEETVFCVVDRKGVDDIIEYFGRDLVKVIFINTPKELRMQRMIDRGDSVLDIEKRMQWAEKTCEDIPYITTDYFINNTDINVAKKQIDNIFWIKKEKTHE